MNTRWRAARAKAIENRSVVQLLPKQHKAKSPYQLAGALACNAVNSSV